MSKPTLKMTHGAIGEAMCCYTDGSYKDADIALTEYENSIRADAIRKFARWLVKNVFNGYDKFWKGNTPHDKPMSIEDLISEYEEDFEKEWVKGVEND